MSDFQQNTITNRQALLDYIDTNSGGSQNLSDVLNTGNSSGANDIVFDVSQGLLFDNNSRLREGTIDAELGGLKGIAQICGAGYEMKWEGGVLYVMGSSGNTIRHSLYNFNNQPGSNDDHAKGYEIGSIWTLDNGDAFICTDDTTSNASWAVFAPLLGQVLEQPNSNTGNQDIKSPDLLSTLSIIDGQAIMTCADGVNITNQVAISQTNVQLLYDDSAGEINHELRVDADGYYMKDIPAHDDDAAAVLAGLTAGYVFQTTGSGAITTAGVVCIVQ